ncbi:hypothetical protein Tco_0075145, partial [Tanacetum coccineum]
DYLVEEELRLCLEAEERMRLEHEKNIMRLDTPTFECLLYGSVVISKISKMVS